jgi:23S rRNA pseudouridine2605 synthase
MRLNKYIALSGAASRRKADEFTLDGRVKVNGRVVSTPGYDVLDGDIVELDGRRVTPSSKRVYLMLNKPKGYITSVSDERGRPTVMELVNDVPERVFPVGRLDEASSGLIIMTNDGDFAYRITHPAHEINKLYRVRVSGVMSRERLAALRKGVDIGGYVTAPAKLTLVRQSDRTAIVDISIHEGKNRQVRKMFAAVGCKVLDLERVAIGGLRLGGLMPGHYRKLKKEEIDLFL